MTVTPSPCRRRCAVRARSSRLAREDRTRPAHQPQAIKASQWVDNGPGWVAVILGGRAEVLALKPDYPSLLGLHLGVVGPWAPVDGKGANFEVRAFIPSRASEDPVTGSLNAALPNG